MVSLERVKSGWVLSRTVLQIKFVYGQVMRYWLMCIIYLWAADLVRRIPEHVFNTDDLLNLTLEEKP